MPNNDRQCPANFIRHTIQPGDTLYGIASFYGVSIASILLANPGINPYNLVVGTHICIPSPCPAGYRTHVVEPGDTLNRIAVQYNVSLQRILSANPGVNPSNLMIGQRLCIPPMCPEGFIEYTIRQGDTLFAIASRFGTTAQEILNANPLITDPASLRIGQRICIPAGCPEGFMEYTVREGDTLFAIASRFGTTVRELLDNNPLITDPGQIAIGQRICVPAVCPADFTEYTVRQGDTLFAIASRFGTTVQSLLDNNPQITDPGQISIGQIICVPAVCPRGFVEYVIRPGDTLFGIASRFGTTVQTLLDNNPLITDPEQLRVGQRICVPAPAGED